MEGIQIFRILGIPVRVHYTWLIIFLLVVWTLAAGYFPATGKIYHPVTLWAVSTLAAFLFFVSILLHELGHSWVALRNGIQIQGITLFIFGGVAQMRGEAPSPGVEFRIAIAGPLVSLALFLAFGVLVRAEAFLDPQGALVEVFRFLSLSNGILALFNLVPGYPLDGGRILRAVVWHWTGSLGRATRVASQGGKVVAGGLILLGFVDILSGYLINGIWLIFIGLFLLQAADMGYQHLMIHRLLRDVPVREIMKSPVVTVTPNMSLDRIVHDYFFRYGYHSFPVQEGDLLVGILSLDHVRNTERALWPKTLVEKVMDRNVEAFTVSVEALALDTLNKMLEQDRGRLVVVSDGHVVGMISRRDIWQTLKVKMDLGE